MLEKPRRIRSSIYLSWIKGLPCTVCGASPPNDPAHIGTGGLSTKVPDYYTIPLCRRCHTDGPFSYHHLGSREAFSRVNGIVLEHEIFKLLVDYLEITQETTCSNVYKYAIDELIKRIEGEK